MLRSIPPMVLFAFLFNMISKIIYAININNIHVMQRLYSSIIIGMFDIFMLRLPLRAVWG